MSDPTITPEILRAIADEVNRTGMRVTPESLCRWADELERSRAEADRLERYARAFLEGESSESAYGELHPWDHQPESYRAQIKAGVRALLTLIQSEEAARRDTPVVSRSWNSLGRVPEDVQFVTDRDGTLYRRVDGSVLSWDRLDLSGASPGWKPADRISEDYPYTVAAAPVETGSDRD